MSENGHVTALLLFTAADVMTRLCDTGCEKHFLKKFYMKAAILPFYVELFAALSDVHIYSSLFRRSQALSSFINRIIASCYRSYEVLTVF